MTTRFGIGYDVHRLADGERLLLGGVEIEGAARGLVGHSDADVVAHAISDALLGAAGLGDIGDHFPDTDERFRDADSMSLAEEVCAMLAERGWRASNVDVTLIAERPRLSGHREAMRNSLSRTLGLPASAVNVKFTTNEGLGSVGRDEGMAALAVAGIESIG